MKNLLKMCIQLMWPIMALNLIFAPMILRGIDSVELGFWAPISVIIGIFIGSLVFGGLFVYQVAKSKNLTINKMEIKPTLIKEVLSIIIVVLPFVGMYKANLFAQEMLWIAWPLMFLVMIISTLITLRMYGFEVIDKGTLEDRNDRSSD